MGPAKKPIAKVAAKPNIVFCRACLATEGKLVNMQEHKLVGEFFRVSGIAFTKKEKWSLDLCVWCASLLKRCAAFRAKCLRASQCLQQVEGELTTEKLNSIDRFANQLVDLTRTDVELDSFEGSSKQAFYKLDKTTTMPAKFDKLNNTNTEVMVKKELYMEIESLDRKEIKINVVKEDVMNKTMNDDFYDEEYLEMSEDDINIIENDSEKFENDIETTDNNFETFENDIETTVNNFETFENDIETTVNKFETFENDIETTVNNFENDDDFNICNISEIKTVILDEVKTKEQDIKKDKESIPKKKRGKGGGKYQFRTSEDNYMPTVDLEAVKRNYDVDIFVLTHEEQMAEVEARRATAEYQTAPYQCEPCGKHFKDVITYEHHKTKHDEKKGPFECPTCKFRFSWKSRQIIHYDTHRFRFVCRRCPFVCRTRNQAKLHHEWHSGKKYQCKYCCKEFRKLSTYLGHVRLAHKTFNLVCNMCGETFVSDTGLKAHKAGWHRVARKKLHMKCAICSVTFMTLDALDKHKMAVAEHKMAAEHSELHSCVQCGDTFRTGDELKDHALAEHPSCRECNEIFIDALSYHTHVKRKHLGTGNHIGERKAAANRRARALGMPLPHPPPTKRYYQLNKPKKTDYRNMCEHCGKIFHCATLLDYHVRKHRGEKMPFACELCPKSFFIKQHLTFHMRVHTGEKPYMCDMCGMTFTLKCNVQRHIVAVHLKTNPRFPCELCGGLFSTRSGVRLHVSTVHCGLPGPKRNRRKRKPVKTYDSE